MARQKPPSLIVVIDTEEEFDWKAPFSRGERRVKNIQRQEPLMDVYRRHGLIPVYTVDHPVATTPESIRCLKQYLDAKEALIGTHLHPWVNPPYTEELCSRFSFPGNLHPELEEEKLTILTNVIKDNFGQRPTIYKAGRYGLGSHTAEILRKLGYIVDLSIVPTRSYEMYGGPNFQTSTPYPSFLEETKQVLSIPMTAGFIGSLRFQGSQLQEAIRSSMGKKIRFQGILSRLNLLKNVNISPEGIPLEDAKTLTRTLHQEGVEIFTLAYHSSSLLIGQNNYVRTVKDLKKFVSWVDSFLMFFTQELHGELTTPLKIYDQFQNS